MWCACWGPVVHYTCGSYSTPSLLFFPLSSSPPFYILGSKRGAQPVCLRDNSHRAPYSVSYTHLLIQLYTKHYRSSFLPTVLLSSPLLSSSPPPPPYLPPLLSQGTSQTHLLASGSSWRTSMNWTTRLSFSTSRISTTAGQCMTSMMWLTS